MPYFQFIALVFIVVMIAACAPSSTSTPLPLTMMPTAVVSETSTPSLTSRPTYTAMATPTSQSSTGETPIRMIIGDTVLTGRLWNNATARDLIAQLPLTLTFSDFNAQEKLATLPRKLSLEGVPKGDNPNPREIGYYAPSDHLVFYYTDISYFNGIVRIGQFDGDMNFIMKQTGDFIVRIELMK